VPRSIFLGSFRAFGGLLHQGLNIRVWQYWGGRSSTWGSSLWRSISWYFSLRLQEGTLLTPIYSLASFLEGLKAIFIEVEFWVFYSQEGTLQIDDLAIWRVRSPSFGLRLYQGVCFGPIYSLAPFLGDSAAYFLEAEFLVWFSQWGTHCAKEFFTFQLGY
jgi:hypothetical protein